MIICTIIVGDSIPNISFSFFYQTGGFAYAAPLIRTEQSGQRFGWRGFPASGHIWANHCQPAWRISHLENDASNLDALINTNYQAVGGRAARKHVLVVKIGTNNSEASAAAEAARIRTYCMARRSAGWRVILCPNTSGDLASFGGAAADTTYVQPLNAIFDTYTTSDGVDRVVSSADSVMYGTGAYANTTYFSDGIHPTQAGHTRIKADLLTQFNSLVTELGGNTIS